MKLISSVFSNEGSIPSRYTCDGENISPPLGISEVPTGTRSLALLMDDPDVPKSIRPDGMWDHWVVFNIPPTLKTIPEGENPEGVLGVNTGGRADYGGPCPPDKEHRYFFKLYALDKALDLEAGVAKSEVEAAMDGHILDEARLLGTYNRKR